MNVIGWVGGILLALCAIPEAIRTISLGTCEIGWAMLLMWGIGELLVFIYVLPKKDYPLLFNYIINIICIGIMIGYKI